MNDPVTPPDLFLPQASTFAARHDALFAMLCAATVAAVLTICLAALRGLTRAAPVPLPDGPTTRRLGLAAGVGYLLLAGWLLVEAAKLFLDEAVAPADAITIRAHARKWHWAFEYPSGAFSRVLYVPAGRPVRLELRSSDVVHGLAIPAFRVGRVIVPGRVATLWFTATARGAWPLLCAHYCGVAEAGARDEHGNLSWAGHHEMVTTVEAVSDAAYHRLTGPPPPVRGCGPHGDVLYRALQCHTCHSADGSRGTGPTFLGLYGRVEVMSDGERVTVDDAYIRRSILEPNAHVVRGYRAIMPTYRGSISGWQMDEITAYLRTLAAPPATANGPPRPPP